MHKKRILLTFWDVAVSGSGNYDLVVTVNGNVLRETFRMIALHLAVSTLRHESFIQIKFIPAASCDLRNRIQWTAACVIRTYRDSNTIIIIKYTAVDKIVTDTGWRDFYCAISLRNIVRPRVNRLARWKCENTLDFTSPASLRAYAHPSGSHLRRSRWSKCDFIASESDHYDTPRKHCTRRGPRYNIVIRVSYCCQYSVGTKMFSSTTTHYNILTRSRTTRFVKQTTPLLL